MNRLSSTWNYGHLWSQVTILWYTEMYKHSTVSIYCCTHHGTYGQVRQMNMNRWGNFFKLQYGYSNLLNLYIQRECLKGYFRTCQGVDCLKMPGVRLLVCTVHECPVSYLKVNHTAIGRFVKKHADMGHVKDRNLPGKTLLEMSVL